MIYECSGPRFDSLKNPYTGEPLHPRMSVSSGGRILFFAPDTYTPAQPFPSARDAYRAWNRVDGVEGLKDGRPVTCAYTGKAMHLVHDGLGYRYEGGYDPRLLLGRQAFLYYASMRDGRSEYPPPGPESRVDKPAAAGRTQDCTAARHVEEHKAEVTEEAVKTAEEIMKKHKDDVEPSSTVSMAVPDKSRSKGAGRRK